MVAIVCGICLAVIAGTGQNLKAVLEMISNTVGNSRSPEGDVVLTVSPTEVTGADILALQPPPAYGTPTLITVHNASSFESRRLAASIEGSGFEIVADGDACSGVRLQPGADCSIGVRPVAQDNGPVAATLHVDGANPLTVPLSGTADGFIASLLVDAAPLAIVADGISPGACTALTVNNNGTLPVSGLKLEIADDPDGHFAACAPAGGTVCGDRLDYGASCVFGIQASGSRNDTFSGTALVSAAEPAPVQRELQGTVRNLAAMLTFAWADAPPAIDGTSPSPCAALRLGNTGRATAQLKSFAFATSDEHFALCTPPGDGGCSALPAELPPGGSCAVGIQLSAATDNSYADTLLASYSNAGETQARQAPFPLTGTAVNLPAYRLVWQDGAGQADAVGTGFTVAGPGYPATGESRSFTLRNIGEIDSLPVTVDIGGSGFVVTATSCTNTVLTPQSTCTASVAARSTADGALSANLRARHGGAMTPLALSGTASGWPTTLAWRDANGTGGANGSNLGITGTSSGGTVTGAARSFALVNIGTALSGTIAVSLSDSSYYAIVNNGCTGALAPGQKCLVSVAPTASGDAAMAALLRASHSDTTVQLSLSGSASGWPHRLAWMDQQGLSSADGSGFTVTGTTGTVDGPVRRFMLKNIGTGNSGSLSIGSTNTANFVVANVNCPSVLAANGSCLVQVTPRAANQGSFQGLLRASESGTAVDLPLQSTASGWPAILAWQAVGGGTANGAQFNISAPDGGTVTGPTVVYALTNTGMGTSGNLTIGISANDNLRIASNGCGAPLVSGQSCRVTVASTANHDGALSATLSAIDGNATPVNLALSGTARDWPLSVSWLDAATGLAANGAGTDVVNTAHQTGGIYSPTRTFLLHNYGQGTTQSLSPQLTSTANYRLGGGTCSGIQLGPNAECSVVVQAYADRDMPVIASQIAVTVNGRAVTLPLSGAASGWPASISWRDADSNGGPTTSFNLVGNAGGTVYSPTRSYTLTNGGYGASSALTVSLNSGANFQLTADQCSGRSLALGQSCTVTVRAFASGDLANFGDTISVRQAGALLSYQPLYGTATGWPQDNRWFTTVDTLLVAADGTGMNVVNTDKNNYGSYAYGAARLFTLKNVGQGTTATLSSAELTDTANFQLGTDNCRNKTLAPGATCTVTVTPYAYRDAAPISSTLRILVNDRYVTVPLSGSATGFNPQLTWRDAAGTGSASGGVFGLVGSAGGQVASQPVVYSLVNTGYGSSQTITAALSSTTNFEFVSNDCSGKVLKVNERCQVSLRSFATGDATLSSQLQAQQQGYSTQSLTLSGTAAGWPQSIKWMQLGGDGVTLVDADGSGFNVVNTDRNNYGGTVYVNRSFTLKNAGQNTVVLPSTESSDSTNYYIASDGCYNRSLTPGATCVVSVTARSARDNAAMTAMLRVQVNGRYVQTALSGAATGFRPSLVWRDATGVSGADGSPFSLTGADGGKAVSPTVTYKLVNTQWGRSDPLTVSLSSTAAFEIVGNDCNGKQLRPAESCAVSVRSFATGDGSLSSALQAVQANYGTTSLNLTGTAAGWPQDIRWMQTGSDGTSLVDADGSGFNIVNTDRNNYGGTVYATRIFTLKNVGQNTVTLYNGAESSDTTNFYIGSDGCYNRTLAPGNTCTVTVTARAARDNAAMTALLRMQVNGRYVQTQLTGTASGFRPGLAWRDATGAGSPDGTLFAITGAEGGKAVSAPVTYRIYNSGWGLSDPLAVSLSSTTNFEIVSNDCNGKQLKVGDSCAVAVRSFSSGDGAMSSNLQVAQANYATVTLALSGNAYGWPQDVRWMQTGSDGTTLVDADGSGFNLTNTDRNNNGGTVYATRIFTLKNAGQNTVTLPYSAESSDTTNYYINNDGCYSRTLAPGNTCTVTVSARSTRDNAAMTALLRMQVNGRYVQTQLSGIASGFRPSIVWRDATGAGSPDGTVFGISGAAGGKATSPTVGYRVYNAGWGLSEALAVSLSSTANFEIVSNDCTGRQLKVGDSCAVSVRSFATGDGSLSANLQAGQPNYSAVAISLSGNAFGWPQDVRWMQTGSDGTTLVEADGSGFNLTNTDRNNNGGTVTASRTFTLKNAGQSTVTLPYSTESSDSTNYYISVDNCYTRTLAPGATCTVNVTARSARDNAAMTALLRTQVNGRYVQTQLSGIASGFRPSLGWWNATRSAGGDGTLFGMTGSAGGRAVSQTITYMLVNNGYGLSDAVTVGLASTANFEIVSDNCTGKQLRVTDACAVSVRAFATGEGNVASTLQATQANYPVTPLALSGTAAGWPQDVKWMTVGSDGTTLVDADGSAFGVVNTSPTNTGTSYATATRTFTLKNTGQSTPPQLANAETSDSTNFVVSTDNCNGRTLAPGASCTVIVTARSLRDAATMNANLRIAVSSRWVQIPLSGTASGFAPTLSFVDPATGAAANSASFVVSDAAGGAAPWYSASASYRVLNIGVGQTQALSVRLGSSANFQIVSDACSGARLKPYEGCTVTVRAMASTYVSAFSAGLIVEQPTFAPASQTLSGTTTIGSPVLQWYEGTTTDTPATVATMDVVNTNASSGTYYGALRTFTLKNLSSGYTDYFTPSLSNTNNFRIYSYGSCYATRLAAGGTCNISIQSMASANQSLNGSLTVLSNSRTAAVILTGTASGWGGSLTWRNADNTASASGSGFVIDGTAGGTVSSLPVTFALLNNGNGNTAALSTALAANTNYQIVADTCAGAVLAPQQSCAVTVRAAASIDVPSMTATLQAVNGSNTTPLSLSGRATNFPLDLRWIDKTTGDAPSVTGLDVANTAHTDNTQSGTLRTYTLKNFGSGTAPALTVTLSDSSYFVFSNSCAGQALAAGASCDVRITPRASNDNDGYSAIMTASSGGKSLPLTLSGRAYGWPPTLTWRESGSSGAAGTGSRFDIDGASGQKTYSPTVTYTLTNTGSGATDALAMALSSTAYFEIVSDGCSTRVLKKAESCDIAVRSFASVDGTLSASLQARQTVFGTTPLTLSGTARNFPLDIRWIDKTTGDAASGAGMDVANASHNDSSYSGTQRTFTLKNFGSGTTPPLTVSFNSTTNFSVSNSCAGVALAAGATCDVRVTPRSSADSDGYTATMTATAGGLAAPLVLSGRASGWPPSLTWNEGGTGSSASVGSRFDIDGSATGQKTYSPTVSYTLVNNGSGTTDALTASLSVTTAFELVGDGCSTRTLKRGESCTVSVRSFASADGNLASVLQAKQTTYGTTSLNLSGTARNFPLDIRWIDKTTGEPASGSGMDVVNTTHNDNSYSGTQRTFTLKNFGSGTTPALSVGVNSATYFSVSNSCAGQTLTAGAACDVRVTPRSSTDVDSFGTALTASASGTTVSLALSGRASGWPPGLGWYEGGTATAAGVGTRFDIDGAATGLKTYSPTATYTLLNNGSGTTNALTVALTAAANFEIVSDGCSTRTLKRGEGCTVAVRSFATVDGNLYSVLQATQATYGTTPLTLNGTARNFPLDMRWIDKTSGLAPSTDGMDVTNTTHYDNSYSGTQRTFTLKNFGSGTSPAISVALSDSSHFSMSNSCAGQTLTAGATCDVRITPTSSTDVDGYTATLTATVGGRGIPLTLTGRAAGWAPSLVWSEGNGSGSSATVGTRFDIDGSSGQKTYSPTVAYTLVNNGSGATNTLTMALSSTAAFELVADGCSTRTLKRGESCSVSLRSFASADGNLSTSLQAAQATYGTTQLSLSGTARNFPLDVRWIDATSGNPADGSGMTVANTAQAAGTYSGTQRSFTLKNFSSGGTTPGIAVSISDSSNFSISDSCSSRTLAPGATCIVRVTPTANRDLASFAATLAANIDGRAIPLALSGSASGWPPTMTWRAADNSSGPSGNRFDIDGSAGGTLTSPTVSYILANTGVGASTAIAVSLSSTANFALVGDDCTGRTLQPSDSCTVSVRATASGNIAMSTTLRATQPTWGTVNQTLTGTASNWPQDVRWWDAATGQAPDGSGMNVAYSGGSGMQYGTTRTFTLKNLGSGVSAPVYTALTDSTNFQMGPDYCYGNTLAAGATCSLTITPRATQATATMSAVLRATVGGVTSAVSLSGTAQGFAPSLNWRDAAAQYSPTTSGVYDLDGSGGGTRTSPAYGMTLVNTGSGPTGSIALTLSSTANFTLASDSCSGKVLQAGGVCSFSVSSVASADNASMATTVRATQSGATVTLPLLGIASGWPLDARWVSADGSRMDLTNGNHGTGWIYGTDRSFTLQNYGSGVTPSLSAALTENGHFAITSDGCSGRTLAPGASCVVKVRAQSSTDYSYSGQLRVNVAGNWAIVALSGTASGWPAILDWRNAANTGSPGGTGFSVTQAGGSSATYTLRNTGTGNAAALAIAVNNGNFQITGNTCGAALAYGGTCQVTVQATAAANGNFSGVLSASATYTTGTVTLALSGTAAMN